jgi:hypothetical protein
LEGWADSTKFPTTSGAFQRTLNSNGGNVFVAKFDPALSGAASLVYSTLLGGSGKPGDGYVSDQPYGTVNEISGGIAVDSAGNAYVTSAATSSNFPTTAGAYQTTYNNDPSSGFATVTSCDAFVTKLNATGRALVYSTYLGGGTLGSYGTLTGGASITLDANDDAYVTGWTNSKSFPTQDPIQSTNNGGMSSSGGLEETYNYNMNSFVTELNPSCSRLLFSTYLGGSGNDYGYGIALDSAGNVYVVGQTGSPNFPTTAGAYQTTPGGGFVSKITGVNFVGPSFAITGPATLAAGAAGTFTLNVLNPDGSADTNYSGTVQVTSSDPHAVLPGNVTIANGTGTFSVTLVTAGAQSVTATDVTNPDITGGDSGKTVNPAAASQVVFTGQPPSGIAGQTLGTVAAAIEDAYGNLETGDNSDAIAVSVNSGPSARLGGTLTETVQAGIALFSNLQLNTSGNYTLAAEANLTGGGTLGPAVSSDFTVASPVSLKFGSITYNSRTGLHSETVTLTNITSGTLSGPMSLVLMGLPSGVVLTDATGKTNGNSYVRFLKSGQTLRKGASVSITLTFTAPSLSDITFGTEVVVGL